MSHKSPNHSKKPSDIPSIQIDSGSGTPSANNSIPASPRINPQDNGPSRPYAATGTSNTPSIPCLDSKGGKSSVTLQRGTAKGQQQQRRPRPIYSQIKVLPRSLEDVLNEDSLTTPSTSSEASSGDKKRSQSKRSLSTKSVSFDSIAVKVSRDDDPDMEDDEDYYNAHSSVDHERDLDDINEYTMTSHFAGLSKIDSKTPSMVRESRYLKGANNVNSNREGFAQNVGISEDSLIKNYEHAQYMCHLKKHGKGRSVIVMLSGRRHTWVGLDFAAARVLRDGDHLIVATRIPDQFRSDILKKSHSLRQQRIKEGLEEDKSKDEGKCHRLFNKEDIYPELFLQVAKNIHNYFEFLTANRDLVIKLSIEIYLSSSTKVTLSEILKVHDPQFIVVSNKPNLKFAEAYGWNSSRISDRLVQYSGIPVIVVPSLKSDNFEFKLWEAVILDHNLNNPDDKLELEKEYRLRTKLELMKTSRAIDDFVEKNFKHLRQEEEEEEEEGTSSESSGSDSDSDSAAGSDSGSDDDDRSGSRSVRTRGRRRGKAIGSPRSNRSADTRESSRDPPLNLISPISSEARESFSDASSVGSEDDSESEEQEQEQEEEEEDDDFDKTHFGSSSMSTFTLTRRLKAAERKIEYHIDHVISESSTQTLTNAMAFINDVNHDMNETLQKMIDEETADPESAKLARTMTGLAEITKSKSMLDFDINIVDKEHKMELDRKLKFLNFHEDKAGLHNALAPGPPSAASKSIKFDEPPTPGSCTNANTNSTTLSPPSSSLRRLVSNNDAIKSTKRPDLVPVKSAIVLPSSSLSSSKRRSKSANGSRASLSSVSSNGTTGSANISSSSSKRSFFAKLNPWSKKK